MTPDVYSNLTILNCTGTDLTSGSGGDNAGFFHEYQMESWFGPPDCAAPSPVVAEKGSATYMLQFQRGVGDEDDGADMQLNAGTQNIGAENVVWLQGRSTDTSGHYIQAVVQPATAHGGPYVIAWTTSGDWPATSHDAATLNWGAAGMTVQLGTPNADQALAVIDLGALGFPADLVTQFVAAIKADQMGGDDAGTIWYAMMQFLGRIVA